MTRSISDPLMCGRDYSGSPKLKEKNYTDEQVTDMKARYAKSPIRDTVNAIALDFGKTERSIIAKLSNLKVYVAPKRTTKSGAPIVKKETLVAGISARLEVDMPSLVKANKQDLEKLTQALDEWLGEEE